MKKILSVILAAALVWLTAVSAAAAGLPVVFTDDSSFAAGGTVKVDTAKTCQNIVDLSKNAAERTAATEGNMQYYWFKDGVYFADGETLALTRAENGCQILCKVYLFSDPDRTQQCGVYDSAAFNVSYGSQYAIPDITTDKIADGKVGESYYQKLDCTDPDVVYTLFRSALPDGLYLTQHGEIEGTPTKAGSWHVVIMVTPEGGEDYANTKTFDMTIAEKGGVDIDKFTGDVAPVDPPGGQNDPAEGTNTTDPTTDQTDQNGAQNKNSMPWWGVLLIAIAAAGVGVGITIVVLKKKKA